MTKSGNALKVKVIASSDVALQAEEYINLWIPAVSFWSFLQSHPFMVASSQTGEQTILDLLIEPQAGFTSELLRHAKAESETSPANLFLACSVVHIDSLSL